jgi:hypothetical protein
LPQINDSPVWLTVGCSSVTLRANNGKKPRSSAVGYYQAVLDFPPEEMPIWVAAQIPELPLRVGGRWLLSMIRTVFVCAIANGYQLTCDDLI